MATTRTPQSHFLVRTVTYRVPVERDDPESVTEAYKLLADVSDTSKLSDKVETEVSKPKFWKRPAE